MSQSAVLGCLGTSGYKFVQPEAGLFVLHKGGKGKGEEGGREGGQF